MRWARRVFLGLCRRYYLGVGVYWSWRRFVGGGGGFGVVFVFFWVLGRSARRCGRWTWLGRLWWGFYLGCCWGLLFGSVRCAGLCFRSLRSLWRWRFINRRSGCWWILGFGRIYFRLRRLEGRRGWRLRRGRGGVGRIRACSGVRWGLAFVVLASGALGVLRRGCVAFVVRVALVLFFLGRSFRSVFRRFFGVRSISRGIRSRGRWLGCRWCLGVFGRIGICFGFG